MSDEFIEIDLETRMTILVPARGGRGGVGYAARINHLIRRGLEADGFVFKPNPGTDVPLVSTDVYRMAVAEEDPN